MICQPPPMARAPSQPLPVVLDLPSGPPPVSGYQQSRQPDMPNPEMIVEPPVVRGPVEPHVKGDFQPYDNSSDYVDKLDDNDAKSDSQNSDTGKEKVLTT